MLKLFTGRNLLIALMKAEYMMYATCMCIVYSTPNEIIELYYSFNRYCLARGNTCKFNMNADSCQMSQRKLFDGFLTLRNLKVLILILSLVCVCVCISSEYVFYCDVASGTKADACAHFNQIKSL